MLYPRDNLGNITAGTLKLMIQSIDYTSFLFFVVWNFSLDKIAQIYYRLPAYYYISSKIRKAKPRAIEGRKATVLLLMLYRSSDVLLDLVLIEGWTAACVF